MAIRTLTGTIQITPETTDGALVKGGGAVVRTLIGTIQLAPQTTDGNLIKVVPKTIVGTPVFPAFQTTGILFNPRAIVGTPNLPGLQASGAIKTKLRLQLNQLYDLGIFVNKPLEQPYALVISITNTQLYESVKVRVQNEQPYEPSLVKALEQLYSWVSRATNTQPLHYVVARSVGQVYSLMTFVANQNEKVFNLLIGDPVVISNSQPFGLKVTSSLNQLYDPAIFVTNANSQLYESMQLIARDLETPYDQAQLIVNQQSQIWSLNTGVAEQNNQPYDETVTVRSQTSIDYSLLLLNPVTKQIVKFYDILDVTVVNITGIPTINFNGNIVQILNASITQDEGSYAWTATVNLANIADYQSMAIGNAFTLNLAGELYNLVVDSKSLNRDAPSSVDLVLSGISPTVKFDAPQATNITKTWTTAILARDAAEEVIGESITWNIVNWVILGSRLAVVNATPIAIVKLIAGAVGGVVETKANGTLQVRPKYPVAVSDFLTATLDHTFTDASDILSVSEKLQGISTINRLRITDVAAATESDTIEYIQDTLNVNKGLLKVYPIPYRTSFTIAHSGLPHVQVNLLGEVARTEVQSVDFVKGAASLSYPVDSITTVVWEFQNLGIVSSTINNRAVKVPETINHGYGRAVITYQTKSINYLVLDSEDESIQFIVVNDS